MSLITNHETTEVPQPGERSLNDPTMSVAAQAATILMRRLRVVPSGGDDRLDAALDQSRPQRIAVVGAIGHQTVWPSPRPARAMGASHRDGIQCGLEQLHFRRGRRVQVNSQRSTRAIDHHHPLCALAALSLSDFSPPFLAGAKLPSAKHSSHRIFWASLRSARNARHMLRKTSSASHACRRRQQVVGLPYSLGSAAQGDPVQAIHRMPSKHWRSSAGGRPPFGRLGRAGRCSRICSHCASVTPCQAMRPFYGVLK